MDLTPRALADVLEAAAATLRDQEHVIDVLKGALAAQGCTVQPCIQMAGIEGLTRQGRALVGALLGVYPRAIGGGQLLDGLPSRDHVADRSLNQVNVVVRQVRKALGQDCIAYQRGVGFSLSAAFYARLNDQPTGETHGHRVR